MRRLLAVLVASVAVVTACGGGGKSPFEVVSAASAETLGAQTSKFTMTVSAEGQDVKVDGAFDYRNQRGRLRMDAASLGIGAASGSIEAVTDGLVTYLKLPQLAEETGGKQWVKLDLQQFGEQMGVDYAALTQTQQQDPTAALDYLRGVSKDGVRKVGEEQVRGTDTTHYRGTADLAAAADKAPAAKRAALRRVSELTGLKEIPFDLWVDGEGRVRRMVVTQDLSKVDPAKIGGQRLGTIKLDMELYDFGAVVDASPPPADQTADLFQLMQAKDSK